ncbi:hypothetical protein [Weissella confusa]|uniref:hypothetical protein n=1 Tax=Weissella confusa TaxID=1583 RepID=UPI0022FF3575|nr:hypothetical protein [Weissella confusa]
MQKRLRWLIVSLLVLMVVSVATFIYVSGHNPGRENTIAENSVTKRTESMIKSAGSSSGNGGQATDIDRESSNFVGEGQLSRVGQYRLTADGIEQKLIKLKSVNKYIQAGDMSYQVTGVAVVREKARDDKALGVARRLYNVPDLPATYYTVTMSYALVNGSVRTVATRGVTTAAFNHAETMSRLTGLVNNGQVLSMGIVPGDSANGSVTVVVPKKIGKNVDEVALQFSALFDSRGVQVTKATKPLKVSF